MRSRTSPAAVTAVAILSLAVAGHGLGAAARGYEQSLGHAPPPQPHGDDSVIDRIRHRGLLEVGVGLFEPWIMCDTNGDLIGYEIDVARKLANGWIAHHRTSGWLAERRAYWFNSRDWAGRVASDPEVVARCDDLFRPDPY